MTWTPEQTTKMLALQQKIQGLGIKAMPSSIEEGPVVTAYMFTLDLSESINKIIKKSEDLALALGEDKVIVQRVKSKIAIFVPNKERRIIKYDDILYWYMHDEKVKQAKLPIALGVDFHGEKSFIDLADMPHILLTGSTGSGKSVFEAAIISNFVYRYDPDELHLYLVDTKRLDLPLFKSLPHIKQVADSLESYHAMMFNIMPEIRRRNEILQNASCRNIQDYHRLMGGITSMPYIVLMIDEMADLIDQDKLERKIDKEAYEDTPTVHQWIKQCSQIARAAGVHMICCTQRASVKIIDGDTKTNLPCRISLRVATRVDSQVILDEPGAENLLGKGDMLIKRPESDILTRYHGPFVSMDNIQYLVANYNEIRRAFV